MQKTKAASARTRERLELLLDWLNDDDWERNAARWRRGELKKFLAAFDGSEAAGFIIAEPTSTIDGEALGDLHWQLNRLLASGFPNDPRSQTPQQRQAAARRAHTLQKSAERANAVRFRHQHARPATEKELVADRVLLPVSREARTTHLSFDFSVERLAPGKVTDQDERRTADNRRRLKELRHQPGSYVMRVSGATGDLVVWLVMHVLTLPGGVALMRCRAPKPYSLERCGRFFLQAGPGRPRETCSPTCTQRIFWESDRTTGRGKAARVRNERRRIKPTAKR